jgi:signal transduction histidine kinase
MAATLALIAGVLLLLPDAWFSPRWQVAIAGAAFAAATATARVAAARYLQQRDPLALMLAIGFGVLAVQAGVFGVWWPITHDGDLVWAVTAGAGANPHLAWHTNATAPVDAWQLGLAVAGVAFVIGNPWWDRRGRRPIPPWLAVGVATVVILVADIVIWLRAEGTAGDATEASPMEGIRAGTDVTTFATGLGIVAVLLLAVALGVELFGRRTRSHPWFAVTFATTIPLALAQLRTPTFGQGEIQWADILLVAMPAFALLGLLASWSADASRMRRASDRAEEVLTGRAEIAAMVAHDVRGPLGTMKGLATTVRTSYEQLSDEERLEFIGMIERESTRLLGLVEHIALALRVDAGTLDLTTRPQPLAPLVRHAVEGRNLPPHPLEVAVDEAVRAPADAKWLPVAIGEALDNAARFSPPEAPIVVRLGAAGPRAIIEIEDRGPGVPPERRDEVFGRFARWRPPGYEDRPGSGLGLFICRGIVRVHGGEASLVASPDAGTILRIELPLEGTGSG